ncbi:hypothetical protein [Streptomyces sp. BA2]|uniref:hypothetical protein n=1 Tax=Streptomyces sp. BA2 TaxID=436595 RepID=UPI001328D36E|nr:hypothetical protein [Streptomyces sp. BA2]MWA16008.1 hypothetical protein [Streptomyces sp. BA2]
MGMGKGKRKSGGGAGRTFAVLGGHHELEVRRLTWTSEQIELFYRITPALPERWADEPDGSMTEAGPPIFLSLEAEDDLGGEYTDGGGAFGTDPEGRFTEGSVSLQPGPTPGAGSLALALSLTCGEQQSTHRFDMPL